MRPPRLLSSVEAEQELATIGGVPIDRVAWRVVQKGEHFDTTKKITQVVFDAQPPFRGMRRARHEQRPMDLRGRRIGRLVVKGYWGRSGDQGGQQNQRWVCRCDCGLYVIRSGRTVIRAKDPDDKCDYCRQLTFLKQRETFLRLGYNQDERVPTSTTSPK